MSESKHTPGLLDALKLFVSCTYPVATEINPRGYNWRGESCLDEALVDARAAIACATGAADIVPDLLGALKGMADAYVALLLMKAEDPSRFKEPGSPYAKAIAAIAKATGGRDA